jgi:hypothetical protein
MRKEISNPMYVVEIFLRALLRLNPRLYTRGKRKKEEE